MKFRDKKTGQVYDLSELNAMDSGFCYSLDCTNCKIYSYTKNLSGEYPCSRWIRENPEKAAELMDYEYLVENKDTVQDTNVTRKSILEAAEKCVCGDRDQQYGSPEDSFKAIASMWNSYLYAKGLIKNSSSKWKGIKPDDVAAMMVLFKIARVATGQNKADNWIDAAGYAACGGEIGGSK